MRDRSALHAPPRLEGSHVQRPSTGIQGTPIGVQRASIVISTRRSPLSLSYFVTFGNRLVEGSGRYERGGSVPRGVTTPFQGWEQRRRTPALSCGDQRDRRDADGDTGRMLRPYRHPFGYYTAEARRITRCARATP